MTSRVTRTVRGHSPSACAAAVATSPESDLSRRCTAIYDLQEYEAWLHEERGFAQPSIDAFLREA